MKVLALKTPSETSDYEEDLPLENEFFADEEESEENEEEAAAQEMIGIDLSVYVKKDRFAMRNQKMSEMYDKLTHSLNDVKADLDKHIKKRAFEYTKGLATIEERIAVEMKPIRETTDRLLATK